MSAPKSMARPGSCHGDNCRDRCRGNGPDPAAVDRKAGRQRGNPCAGKRPAPMLALPKSLHSHPAVGARPAAGSRQRRTRLVAFLRRLAPLNGTPDHWAYVL